MPHLVLDLDGTLLSDAHPRPHLNVFLKFCKKHFETVSVWTAASRDWWCYCYGEHLRWFDFDRVLTDVDCEIGGRGFYFNGEPSVKKPLAKHWEINKTLIVDDTPQTAIDNPANLIEVKTWNHEENDAELLQVKALLRERLAWFAETGDVRVNPRK